MDLETAKDVVFLYTKSVKDPKVRFFGGEPLLNFSLIKKIVKEMSGFDFDLTTNGLLLEEKHLRFFRSNPKVELIISSGYKEILGKKELIKKVADLPNTSINLNLTQDNLGDHSKIFNEFVEVGFNSFNFLPIYYTSWSNENLRKLKQDFSEIVRRVKKEDVLVKNIDNYSPVPLFNIKPVVDCDGAIYAGNMFLDKRVNPFKKHLKIGEVPSLEEWKGVEEKVANFDYNQILKKLFSKEELQSTKKVDSILTNFVNKIKK